MRIQHLIDGKPVDSRSCFETVNPATQEVLAEVANGGEGRGPCAWLRPRPHFPSGLACQRPSVRA